jgi:hypothetical protein
VQLCSVQCSAEQLNGIDLNEYSIVIGDIAVR